VEPSVGFEVAFIDYFSRTILKNDYYTEGPWSILTLALKTVIRYSRANRQILSIHSKENLLPVIKKVFLFITMGFSAIWIFGASIFVVSNWETSMSATEKLYQTRKTLCKNRYADAAARERCIIIMDLENFQEKSIAIFNRSLLIIGLPTLAVVIVYILNRRNKCPQKRRK